MPKPYFSNPKVEAEAAKVYKDGFNIYQMTSRMKKHLKRTEDFPDGVMLRFCEAYWKNIPQVKNSWPYFTKTFAMVSAEWHAQQNEREGEDLKKAPVPQAMKDIMKGMFK
jgi:hypothetical protein